MGALIRVEPPPESPGEFNFSRKAYHAFGLVVPLALYVDLFAMLFPDAAAGDPHLTRRVCLWMLGVSCIILLAVDTIRFRYEPLNRLFIAVVGPLLKAEERDRYNATIPYFAACFILFWTVSDVTAMVACTFLMIGDPFAAFVGSRVGRIRFWNGKSLEGLAAFVLFGAGAALLFLWAHTVSAEEGAPFALRDASGAIAGLTLAALFAGALAASLAEFFSGSGLRGLFDDNLIVPICGAAGMGLAALGLGAPAESIFFDARLLF